MKQFLLAAAFTAAATALPAGGREALVQRFDSPATPRFILLQPGVHSPASDADASSEASPRLTLASAFDSLSEPVPLTQPRSVLTPEQTAGLGSPLNGASTALCPVRDYRPRHGLRPHEELRRARYFTQMAQAACGAGVPVDLFDALIVQESRYDPAATSNKGASGLTQLMPATATQLGVWDRWNVEQNLDGGARYLRQQLDSFGNWALALSAYNAGPGNVQKHRGIPPFKETRAYVRTILASIEQDQRASFAPASLLVPSVADPVPSSPTTSGVQLLAFSR